MCVFFSSSFSSFLSFRSSTLNEWKTAKHHIERERSKWRRRRRICWLSRSSRFVYTYIFYSLVCGSWALALCDTLFGGRCFHQPDWFLFFLSFFLSFHSIRILYIYFFDTCLIKFNSEEKARDESHAYTHTHTQVICVNFINQKTFLLKFSVWMRWKLNNEYNNHVSINKVWIYAVFIVFFSSLHFFFFFLKSYVLHHWIFIIWKHLAWR